jgi:hypothetical protein
LAPKLPSGDDAVIPGPGKFRSELARKNVLERDVDVFELPEEVIDGDKPSLDIVASEDIILLPEQCQNSHLFRKRLLLSASYQ